MTLQVAGVGLGRTGTHSLKLALEEILGGPCYHMFEVFEHPEHVAVWHRAARGEPVDWDEIFGGFVATVDWPGAAFWREITAAAPSALVLLSTRRDPQAWWESANRTIWEATRRQPPPELAEWAPMWHDILRNRFTERWSEPEAAMAAYERHNDDVRATIPTDRLLEWQPGDGWAPICRALDLPVPETPFPHVNSTAEFRAMAGFEAPPPGECP